MSTRNWKDIRKKVSPERARANEKWVADEIVRMNLAALRNALGKTQGELAPLLEMSQSELSRTERRDDHLISTLRRYVEALGGKLEVSAVFKDQKVPLEGV